MENTNPEPKIYQGENLMITKDKIDSLIPEFNKWYEKDHSRNRDYEFPFTKKFIETSSDREFIDAIDKFAREGGGIQSGGQRQAPNLKQSVSEKTADFRKYLLAIWDNNFDLKGWMDNKDFTGWGQGTKTIFLFRAFPDKYLPWNNKTEKSLKILELLPPGKGGKDGEYYLEIMKALKNFIQQNELDLDFHKADSLMHYIAGDKEGQEIAQRLFGDKDPNGSLETKLTELLRKYNALTKSPLYQEKYKWEYLEKHQHIFADLDNLPAKFTQLRAPNFYPFFGRQGGFTSLLKAHAEQFKQILSDLFDESKQLQERITAFRNSVINLLREDPGWQNKTMVDPGVDSASFLLFLKDYKNYLLFVKKGIYKDFAKKLNLSPKLSESSDSPERYIEWLNFCKETLIPIMNKVLQKENTLLDCQDFIYCLKDKEYTEFFQQKPVEEEKNGGKNIKKDIPLNQIFYGPPGTGKTYETVTEALRIVMDESDFNALQKDRKAGLKKFKHYRELGQEFGLISGKFSIIGGEKTDEKP